MARVALGLGSNLGARLANLRDAADRLRAAGEILARSDVFETEPWGVRGQPFFLNACVLMESGLAPLELLSLVKGIEREMGRVENVRWGARLIDIDILLMEGLVFEAPELHIPHINLHDRDFVLVPLRQIAPQWRHPLLGRTVSEIEVPASGRPPLRITAL